MASSDRELLMWAVASTQAYSDAGKYDAGRDMTPRCIEAQAAAERLFAELEALRKLAEALLPSGNTLTKRAREKLDHWFYTHGGGVL